jgi:hypothetical protein
MSPESRLDPEHPESGAGPLPNGVGLAITEPDRPILLLAAADAGDSAIRAAIGLADARASLGLPTTLIDGGVTDPRLHRALGTHNFEGLADVFLFGASLPKVASRPAGHGFDFVSAGAYVPDPVGVMDSVRWDRIGAEARSTGSLILLFVPAATPGLGALSRRIGQAILIAGDQDLGRVVGRLDTTCEVLGTIPPRAAAPAGLEAAPVVAAPGYDAQLTEPLVFRSQRPTRSRSGVGIGLVALAFALGIGGWFLYREYIAAPTDPGAAGVEVGAEAAPPPARGEAVETPLPVSVAVEAHQDLLSAQERVAALRRADPAVDFFLAPVAVSGGVYYRLLAGPVMDREAGTALLQRLVDGGHKTAFDTWAVRPTEYAFHLGEYDARDDAVGRVASLADLEIPAYIVRIRYDPGPPRYRVYGGAFETAAEAEVMKELLENAELEARLVPRTGEPAA